MRRRPVLLSMLALTLTACAPAAQPYLRAGTANAQMQGDLETCTFEGRDRTAQAVPRMDDYKVSVSSPEAGPSIVQTRLLAAAKSGAQEEYRAYLSEQVRAYVLSCMQGKGYRQSS